MVGTAFRLLFSFISAVSLLGIPSEVYVYGTQYCTIIFCFPIVAFVVANWLLPVFYKLEVSTSYEVRPGEYCSPNLAGRISISVLHSNFFFGFIICFVCQPTIWPDFTVPLLRKYIQGFEQVVDN